MPSAQYKIHPNYDIGATYVLEEIRSEAGADYTRLHIFWLHLSPHCQVSQNLNFRMRHVLAYRSVESAKNYYVSRHQFSLNYTLNGFGPLVAIGSHTELFYSYTDDYLCENRFVPLKLTFTLSESTKLGVYLMAQSKRAPSDSNWSTAYIFGQSLSTKF